MGDLYIIYQAVKALEPRFTNPDLVDRQNGIIASHSRVKAAKLLTIASIPTVKLADMSKADRQIMPFAVEF